MQDRYALRFETGEREGEVVGLASGTLGVGRRPDSSLSITDGSVSGRHAELVVDESGVLLRDLGSTNGTRVGAQRVIETRLAHGDAILFGNVRLTFLDRTLLEPASGSHAPAAPGPSATSGGDALGRVSEERLARSKRRSIAGLALAVLVIAAVGGGAWWLTRDKGGTRARLRPVVAVPGNRLDTDPSFEGDADGWGAEESAPATFLESASARHAGAVGLSADLASGEWALHRSPPVRVLAGRRLEARAALRARGLASARLGVEFTAEPKAGRPSPGPARAWSSAVTSADGWVELSLAAPVPPGYDQARLVVRGEARVPEGAGAERTAPTTDAEDADGEPPARAGDAAFDDVALLEEAGTAQADLQLAEHRLFLLGVPPREALLFQVDSLLFTGLELVARREGEELAQARALALRLEPNEAGARFVADEPLGPDETLWLVLRAEPALLEGGVGTLGEGGYRTHAAAFEREAVDTLLLGSEHRLLGFVFDAPARVRGIAEGEGGRAEIALVRSEAGSNGVALQLDFQTERRRSDELARAARAAESRGELGGALATWAELLHTSPYEPALVSEAEEARARLVDRGLAEVARIAEEVERARFFGLVDLFRRCRVDAVAAGGRYASSDVEEAAKALIATIDTELLARAAQLDGGEDERLARIQAALEAQGAESLAASVQSWREERAAAGPAGGAGGGH